VFQQTEQEQDMAIERVGVVGAGTMGNGIAQVCATANVGVVMVDISDAAVERGVSTIAASLDRLVKKEKLTSSRKGEILAMVRGTTDYAAIKDCDLVIEAATENLDLKKRILKQIDEQILAETYVATNTSSLSVTELAAVMSNPERFIGMHFFNPVPMMALVELILGMQTSLQTLEVVQGFVKLIGKTSIMAKKNGSSGKFVGGLSCRFSTE
jgi:3-hydroxybutyryl-CoA dehydrogenase